MQVVKYLYCCIFNKVYSYLQAEDMQKDIENITVLAFKVIIWEN